MLILTIDSGTTNTRTCVWKHDVVIAEASVEVGVRDTAVTGSKSRLQVGVRTSIAAALANAAVGPHDIGLVLAAGMITSNLGLFELPHVTTPAGIDDLARHMTCQLIDEVFGQPIWFIPGVRNRVSQLDLDHSEAMDMMRGEEVETFGLLARCDVHPPALIALPGSHSKFVHVNRQRQITGCATTLAGELLGVLTRETILAPSLESAYANDLDASMVRAGAAASRTVGLARACFTVRILDQFDICGRNERANFLLGAILGEDLLALKSSRAIARSSDIPIYIASKLLLGEAMALLLRDDDFFTGDVRMPTGEQQAHLSGFGALQVARHAGLIPADVPLASHRSSTP